MVLYAIPLRAASRQSDVSDNGRKSEAGSPSHSPVIVLLFFLLAHQLRFCGADAAIRDGRLRGREGRQGNISISASPVRRSCRLGRVGPNGVRSSTGL